MVANQLEFKWASFGLRWGAMLIDFNIIVVALMISFKYIISMIKELDISFQDISFETFIILFFAYLFGPIILGIVYRSLFECSKFQGTPGKVAVGIRVVNYDGKRISFSQALQRNSAKVISSLIFYLGYVKVLFSDKKQGLHDVIAKTYVIRKD